MHASHPTLGSYYLYGREPGTGLYTENDTNAERLWGCPNSTPWVKDAFHRYVIEGVQEAVNPAAIGTRFAAWHRFSVAPGEKARVGLVLSARPLDEPFARSQATFSQRRSEADVFYDELLPAASPEDRSILRQALAGMIWSKQFFHYDVSRWLTGDRFPCPPGRHFGRNRYWRHFRASDVISMPDKWEYPWFAAWDLAFHCAALTLIDVDFAKQQIELMLKDNYCTPTAISRLRVGLRRRQPAGARHGRAEVLPQRTRAARPRDRDFLQRVFNKLLLNYAWWINRKDADGHNVFEGGFLGLDNISVFDRSHPLPPGYSLKQADATGWMAMFALNMTLIALELAFDDPNYEDIAIQIYDQFLSIANAIGGHSDGSISLWDPEAGFFKDLVITPDGSVHRIDVYSWVGLIPLFASRSWISACSAGYRGSPPCCASTGAAASRVITSAPARIGKRARRAPAVARGPHHAATHPAAPAERG